MHLSTFAFVDRLDLVVLMVAAIDVKLSVFGTSTARDGGDTNITASAMVRIPRTIFM
jgi:hypothetical protein